ncbi:MAG: hypothetical protein AB1716_18295 [Planctomycetota bacterium]
MARKPRLAPAIHGDASADTRASAAEPPAAPAPLAWARRFLPEYFADEPCAFHVELFATLARPDARLIARVAPRGHAKSTCSTLAYPLWCICEKKRRNIVIVTHEAALATQFVRDIRAELETNELIRAEYGDLCTPPPPAEQSAPSATVPAESTRPRAPRAPAPAKRGRASLAPARAAPRGRWSSRLFTTTTGVTVQAKGSGAAFRGLRVGPQRPDLVICDDIEKDEQVASPAGRRRLEQWLRKVVMPALAPDGQLVVLGSLLHYDSLLANLRDPKQWPHWDYRVHRALEAEELPDGAYRKVALWPARWPVERLELERERIGTIAFEQEYQANPIDDSQRVFRPEWLRSYKESELVPERLVNLMAVDPATGAEGGDFFALWIGSVDTATGIIYTRRLTLERIGLTGQVRRIMAAYQEWRPVQVGIETNAYQIALKQNLEEQGRAAGLYVPVRAMHTRQNKKVRIEGSTPLYENGTFRLPPAMSPEVEAQFLHFPNARHDDAPDVCAMGIDLARAFRTLGRVEGAVARQPPERRESW